LPKLRHSFSWPASTTRRPSCTRDLTAAPPVCCRTRGHHHLSAQTRPLHHAEDRDDEAAVPLKRAMHSPAPYSRWATASHPSFWGTSGASPQTCQTTSSIPFGPAGYPPRFTSILVGQPNGSLNAAARCADHISEVALQLTLWGSLSLAADCCAHATEITRCLWNPSFITVFPIAWYYYSLCWDS
jgi:hypothetical protein